MEDIGAQVEIGQQPRFQVAKARVIGAASHVEAEIRLGVRVDLAQETLGVGIGVLGGIKGLALDRMEIHRHLLHLKEGGGRGKIAAGFLGVHAARKQRDDGALAGLGGTGQGGRAVLIDAIVI